MTAAWAMPAAAATLYWDINGNTAGLGGTGTWDTSSAFWNSSATGTGGVTSAWNNGNVDTAVFAGTAGTVSLGAPVTAGGLSFNTTGYTITGSTLTLGGATPTITTNAGVTATLSSIVAGSAGLTKAGAGTLTLGGANTFSGGITVNAGTLGVTGNTAFGDVTNGLTMANGTALNLTGATAASRVVTLTSGSVTLSGATVSARFTGAGGLQVQPGVVLNNNASDYTGQTQFNGNLSNSTYSFSSIADLGVASALGAPTTAANGTIVVANSLASPTLSYTGGTRSSNRDWVLQNGSNGGTVTLRNASSGTLTLTGNILMSGNGGLGATFNANIGDLALFGVISSNVVKAATYSGNSPARVITLGGANTYSGNSFLTGPVTVRAPVLADQGAVSSLGTASAASGVTTIALGSKLSYTGAGASSNRGWNFNNGAGTLSNDGTGALALSGGMTIFGSAATLGGTYGGSNSFSGVISATGSLTVNTAGTWLLAGANTYTGGTTISAGTLQLGNGGTSGSIVGNVTNNAALVFDRSDAVTFAGVVSGTGTVTKRGADTLTLTADNTYTGGTTVSAGTLQLGNGGTSGSIVGNVTNNATLAFNQSDINTYAGVISGSGVVQQIGTGTTVLAGASTYTGGTLVSSGTLQLGAGGTSGSIVGDVTNNATLAFNRSDVNTFAGVVSGTGAVNQIGTGTTVLTGTNTYSGATTVSAGSLLINGDQTGATGLTSVAKGATLGGSGIIGGDVVIADGILAPGNSPGTLTIAGNLSLGAASQLNYELGAANTVGGPLNDLTVVGGNLTLDGTLNVAQSAGGTYGAGIYRLVNYAGTLTDNGLLLGSMPAGSVNYVQTSVANQVNLVNSQGVTVSFWDGDAGGKNDGAIAGGNGTWLAGPTGTDRWTQADGQINAPYLSPSYAVFTGAPGTVTVDNSLGQVSVTGMQFATDGYVIQGGDIDLTTGANSIRVGDGTSAGAATTATIASALIGAGGIDKADAGTLVLTGVNTYTGGTLISGGTLRLGDGGTSGSIVGDVTNNATLAFNRSDVSTFAGVVSGTGAVQQIGSGTTVLSGDNTYAGGTTITAGTLQLGDGGTSGSIVGDVTNNATLAFNRSDASTFAGVVSGTGAVQQIGSGTTALTGTNTYTGGTTIAAGTLQLGDGGTTGSIVGDVTNNATLAFNRSDVSTFAGVISGTGAVQQIGTGTTALTGTNTYTGGTTIAAGTLQLGDGGTTGSIVGDVTNNGALAFNRSDASTFAGVVSGTGAVQQIGSGTTTLTGTNTYTGGTTVTAGTLQLGDGGTTGSIVGDVTNNATLAFNRSDLSTFAGVISGAGAVQQIGTGTTVLSGDNTYNGTTLISSGTLQLGDGGTTGSIVGDVTNNATLAFNRSDASTFAGVVSGTGAVQQIGTGNTTLAGVNTYTGGTTITAGTLTGSATSFGTGTIANNAALVIDQPADASFANAIDGSGTFMKTGAGTLELTGTSAFTGATTVSQGTLAVSGSLASSAVTVGNGATLSGTGTVGATMLQAGATIRPGTASMGNLNVNGNFAQEAGSTYQVRVDPATTSGSDRISVTGAASIAGGSILNVTRTGTAPFALNSKYTVLSAAGGVSGAYTLTGDTRTAFVQLGDTYDANNVYLTASQVRSFMAAAAAPNQIATAGALDTLSDANALRNAVAFLPDDSAARAAFDQLSGEQHASAQTALMDDSRFVREAANDRLLGAFCSPGASSATVTQSGADAGKSPEAGGCAPTGNHVAWGRVFASTGRFEGDGNAQAVKRDIGGFFVGADTSLDGGWRVGALGGFSHASLKGSGSGKTDDYHLGVYAGNQWDKTSLRLGASYTWHKLDMQRSVGFAGFSDSLSTKYDGSTAQVFAEVGQRLDLSGGMSIEPFAGLAYVRVKTDGYTERGGLAALTSGGASFDAAFSTVGARFSAQVGEQTTLRGLLGWRHAIGDVAPQSTHAFAAGGRPFTVSGVPLSRDVAVVEAGVETALRPNLKLSASYSGQFGSKLRDNGLKVSLAYKF